MCDMARRRSSWPLALGTLNPSYIGVIWGGGAYIMEKKTETTMMGYIGFRA